MHKIAEKGWSEGIFKAYDIRGRYPEEINENAAYKIARAFVRYVRLHVRRNFNEGGGVRDERLVKLVVSADARESSPALKTAFLDGLTDEGAEVIDAGLTTTPMHYFIVNKTEADGGAMITASHLPLEFNGIKLSKKGAMPLSAGAGMDEVRGDAVRGIFESVIVPEVENKYKITKKDFIAEYIEFLSDKFPNLKSEIKQFVSGKKNPAISFDADEDRVMFQNADGTTIPGDIITALLAQKYAKHGEKIVYDLRASRIVKEIVQDCGAEAIESRVGHSFIKPLMKKENAVFGGEVSGHFYFRDFFYCDSGIYAALAVLDIVRADKKTLSETIKPFQKYAKSGELNYEIKDKDKALDKIAARFQNGKISYLDGIKVEFWDDVPENERWWFNLRPSNTEDLIRLNIEAATPVLLDEKKKLLEELLK